MRDMLFIQHSTHGELKTLLNILLVQSIPSIISMSVCEHKLYHITFVLIIISVTIVSIHIKP